jgi:hypothetical protein
VALAPPRTRPERRAPGVDGTAARGRAVADADRLPHRAPPADTWDAVVVGGAVSGPPATLARPLPQADLVLDHGQNRNRSVEQAHGYLAWTLLPRRDPPSRAGRGRPLPDVVRRSLEVTAVRGELAPSRSMAPTARASGAPGRARDGVALTPSPRSRASTSTTGRASSTARPATGSRRETATSW